MGAERRPAIIRAGVDTIQTFVPYADFEHSAHVLDRKRLGGQRKECVQLIRALDPHCQVGTPLLIARKNHEFDVLGLFPARGWANHAAAKMWRGRIPALLHYLTVIDLEWKRRGYNSTLVIPDMGPVVMPSWIGDERVHASHRANLMRKLPEHYEQFGWTEDPTMEYFWPGPCANLPADPVVEIMP